MASGVGVNATLILSMSRARRAVVWSSGSKLREVGVRLEAREILINV